MMSPTNDIQTPERLISRALRILDKDLRQVLILHNGNGDTPGLSFEALTARLDLPSQDLIAAEKTAIRNLRRPSAARLIVEALRKSDKAIWQALAGEDNVVYKDNLHQIIAANLPGEFLIGIKCVYDDVNCHFKEAEMKSYRKELWFEVPTRRAFVNITPEVEECLRASGIKEGLVLVNAMHITASVFINDDESGLHHDYDVWLEKIAPHEPVSGYRHNVGEDNADAHMKRQVMGREVVVAVTDGRLDFGTWEQIFYGEFDGRRRKRVLVKIIGE